MKYKASLKTFWETFSRTSCTLISKQSASRRVYFPFDKYSKNISYVIIPPQWIELKKRRKRREVVIRHFSKLLLAYKNWQLEKSIKYSSGEFHIEIELMCYRDSKYPQRWNFANQCFSKIVMNKIQINQKLVKFFKFLKIQRISKLNHQLWILGNMVCITLYH